MVASVGPTCSETLVAHGIAIELEPAHPKMGPLVQETAQRAKEILRQKRKQESGRVRSPESGVRSHYTESSESLIPNPESLAPSPDGAARVGRFTLHEGLPF